MGLSDPEEETGWITTYNTDVGTVKLPDENRIEDQDGHTEFYWKKLNFPGGPPHTYSMWFSSDDGLYIWINGTLVDTWGAIYGASVDGCVNRGNCENTSVVQPVDITSYPTTGENLIVAANHNVNGPSYFNIAFKPGVFTAGDKIVDPNYPQTFTQSTR